MKLIKHKLDYKVWDDVHKKILEHAPHDSPRDQIKKFCIVV